MGEYLKVVLVAGLMALLVVLVTEQRGRAAPRRMVIKATTPPEEGNPLDRMVGEVRFDKTPFRDAVERLADVSKTNILVDWHELEGADIYPNSPVTACVRNLKLSDALKIVRANVRGKKDAPELSFGLDQGVVVIAAGNSGRFMFLRLYDSRDLILALARRERDLQADYEAVWGQLPEEAVDAKDGVLFSINYGLSRREYVDELFKLITENCMADTWKDAGGRGGLRELGGFFMVEQTEEVHREVEKYLNELRRKFK